MTQAGKAGPDGDWPEPLLDSVRNLPAHAGLYVALSGGLDSVLLLHTAAIAGRGFPPPTAIHINHQLQPNASDTEALCQRLCQSLGVPLKTMAVDVAAHSPRGDTGTGGLEEAARDARYRAFESCLGEGDVLLMAHHADDQTETVLFRLLRGTGVAGLGGMPRSRALGNGLVYRPFLDFSRQDLEQWARVHDVKWIEDPSNQDQRFDRNFLRRSIIPALKHRWPSLNRRVAATVSACRESEELAASLARIHFTQCEDEDGGLDLGRLSGLTLAEQKNLVRWWVSHHRYSPPNPADWRGLLSDFLASGTDRQPEYRGDGYRLRRFQGSLRLVPDQPPPGPDSIALMAGQPMTWGGWLLELRPAGENEKPAPELRICARQGGERIRPRADGPSKPLKNWLQEQAVPTWERGGQPLVMESSGGAEALVAVGDLWVSERYCGEAPASGWRLILERDSN
jgi:tRNA(Ile)-lysidine synthase